jgi:phosphohistidine phosphatase SixA
LPVAANGQPAASQVDAINSLRQGGHVIVFRHGATYSDQADTDPLNPNNVARQRQLNDDGRALAKSIGESMRKLRIPVGQVQTSMFQRAVDTGTLLGFGEVKTSPDISEGGLVVTPNENNRRTAAFRKLIGEPPPGGSNTVIVSHKPNIVDAFGKDWFDVREGEASVSSRAAMEVTSSLSESRRTSGTSWRKSPIEAFAHCRCRNNLTGRSGIVSPTTKN